ncbi:MAG: phosphoglucosamine mutase, partial [Deltaproteobacteria bacterium]|nr:phosphoglucosamine mutase [Deltaproteobacteria bacterium]
MRKLFGTDGIRGVANVHPMTTEIAMQLGRAVAHIFKDKDRRHRILIGKDTRVSGYMLETALASGICSMGVDVLLVGPIPTPGIAFLTTDMRADAGIVISASHNPFQDNGMKIFCRNGLKLPDEKELEIEELMSSKKIDSLRPTANEVGKAFRIDDAAGRYIVFLKNTFHSNFTLDGFKIVLDCAHGAAYKIAPHVFEELGAKVYTLGIEPDGVNINQNCGALHPEVISQAVKEKGADIGIALDGDADRVIFVDENGAEVDGDHIMAICAVDMHRENRLKKNTVVATVMSNIGLAIALKKEGIKMIRAAVGDRYILEEMLQHGYNFGGEQSGHIIFFDLNTTGDGILSALQVLAAMKKSNKKLSELSAIMQRFPQVIENVEVKNKKDLDSIPEIKKAIVDAEKTLSDKGRILVRFS